MNAFRVFAGAAASLAIFCAPAFATAHENPTAEFARLECPDAQQGARFGASVAMDGTRLAVGAPGVRSANDTTSSSIQGAVYIYDRLQDGRWDLDQRLTAHSETVLGLPARFGSTVALSGNTVVVMPSFENRNGESDPAAKVVLNNAVYVFEKNNNGGWTQTAMLRPDHNVEIPRAIDVHEDTIVVGMATLCDPADCVTIMKSEGEDPGTGEGTFTPGSVYVYRKTATSNGWVKTARLTDPAGWLYDDFGVSVAIEDGDLLVGTYRSFLDGTTGEKQREGDEGGDSNDTGEPGNESENDDRTGDPSYLGGEGTVMAYQRNSDGAWEFVQQIYQPEQYVIESKFGCSLDLEEGVAMIGAPAQRNFWLNGTETDTTVMSMAYAFERVPDGTTRQWHVTGRFSPRYDSTNTLYNMQDFGASVAASQGTVVIGSPAASTMLTVMIPGSAYVNLRGENGGWVPGPILTAPVDMLVPSFGHAVSVAGGHAAVGAPAEEGNGIVWVFSGNDPEPPEGVLQIGQASARCGETVEIPINVASNHPITSFGLDLVYNPECLEYLEILPGASTEGWLGVAGSENEPGRIRIGGFAGDGEPVEGHGQLAIVTFQCIEGACDCESIIEAHDLVDQIAGLEVHPGNVECFDNYVGDVDEDGNVTPSDAQAAFECYILEECAPGMNSVAAQVCPESKANKRITPMDAQGIFELYLGIEPQCWR